MKRRSFLQAIGGAIAAVFVPAVAAKKQEFETRTIDRVVDANFVVIDDYGNIADKNDTGLVYVDGSNDRPDRFLRKLGEFENPYPTLQQAIDASKPGDTIIVKSGHIESSVVQIKGGNKIIGLGPDYPRLIWPVQS